MSDVTIYIASSKGLKLKKGASMYMMEFITPRGETITRDGIIVESDTTENRLVLAAITRALSRMQKSCEISVMCECEHIFQVDKNGWLDKWRIEGWVNSRGEPVKNAKLWQQLSEYMDMHLITFDRGHNPYGTIMRETIEQELRKEVFEDG
jgi:ribonuclease HI